MEYNKIPEELLNELHSIIERNIPGVDSDAIWNIKAETDAALSKIMKQYNLI